MGIFAYIREKSKNLKTFLDELWEIIQGWFKKGKADEVFEGKNVIWKKVSDDILSKIFKKELYQSSSNLDELYNMATIADKELKIITNEIANATKGKAGFRNGLKSRERAIEKIESDYFGDASKLLDIAGSKVIYETVDDLYLALNKFNSEYKILKIKDRIQQPLNGYRDILMNIEAKNGHVVEFRLHLKEIDEIAEGIGHKLYEKQRNLDAILKTRPLIKTEKDLYKELVLKQNQLYEEAWKSIINK